MTLELTPVLSRTWDQDRSWTREVYERHDGYERCRDEQHERACLHIPSLGITTTARLGRLITPQVGAERKILTFAASGRAYEAATKRSSSASSTSTRLGFEPS